MLQTVFTKKTKRKRRDGEYGEDYYGQGDDRTFLCCNSCTYDAAQEYFSTCFTCFNPICIDCEKMCVQCKSILCEQCILKNAQSPSCHDSKGEIIWHYVYENPDVKVVECFCNPMYCRGGCLRPNIDKFYMKLPHENAICSLVRQILNDVFDEIELFTIIDQYISNGKLVNAYNLKYYNI